MKVLLFGVSCVGKTAVGKSLSHKLGWDFYDIDDEIRKLLNISSTKFLSQGTIEKRDRIRGKIIGDLVRDPDDKIIEISPMSYRYAFDKYIRRRGVTAIELRDTPEHIYKRLEFCDINDTVYRDDEYRKSHRKQYIYEISRDLEWYGKVYSIIPNRIDINAVRADAVADRIIKLFLLNG